MRSQTRRAPAVAEASAVSNSDRELYRTQIRAAIQQRHLQPAYQPIVDIRTGALAGFEVLSRWSDPLLGDIEPAEFIPKLESFNLIDEFLDDQLQAACAAAVRWPGQFFLAFNIAPAQLSRPDLAARIVTAIAPTGFALDRVTLEVTEGSLLSDAERAFINLRTLDARGVKIAIDDFGTGYSNLGRLETFPFQKLKIDRSFVSGLHAAPGKRRIAAAIIGLGQSLGITVVAEGVETAADELVLRRLGCEWGQGWLYGKAMPASAACEVAQRRLQHRGSRPSLDHSPFQQLCQLGTLYSQAPVGLALVSRSYHYVRVNERFAATRGMTCAEMEGLHVHDVVQGEALAKMLRVLGASAVTDAPIVEQRSLSGRDVLIFCSRVKDVCDEVIGFSVVAVDITERETAARQLAVSEEHFRCANELQLDIIWGAEPDGTLTYIGPTMLDAPGETMRQRIQRWISRMHPDDYAKNHAKWLQWVPTGRDFEGVFRIQTQQGGYRWMRSRARPQKAPDGTILRWYGIITDIDDLCQLQQLTASE
jgi:PAS domain S-box-containing protein